MYFSSRRLVKYPPPTSSPQSFYAPNPLVCFITNKASLTSPPPSSSSTARKRSCFDQCLVTGTPVAFAGLLERGRRLDDGPHPQGEQHLHHRKREEHAHGDLATVSPPLNTVVVPFLLLAVPQPIHEESSTRCRVLQHPGGHDDHSTPGSLACHAVGEAEDGGRVGRHQ